MHVKFVDREQFLSDYKKILLSKSCYKPESLIPQLEEECERRRHAEAHSIKQRNCVLEQYTPRHPHLYTLQESFLDSQFLEVVRAAKQPDQTSEGLTCLLQDHRQRVFSFPVFTKEFCKMFVEELTHYEEAPLQKGRPNTMNQYGIKLDELGFTDFVSSLQKEYLSPITRLLFPDWGGGSLDSHKAFVVTYKEGEDVDLSYHYDNAEVTLNVALNEDYSNGELYFGPMRSEQSSHRTGYAHQLGTRTASPRTAVPWCTAHHEWYQTQPHNLDAVIRGEEQAVSNVRPNPQAGACEGRVWGRLHTA
ncbi:hypothetical protein O3P69_006134 [Scylla paramamosain]|uniref:Prolyl 4-hydroxylase alpha subunit domain-containing protein n=1 Tax=Scylla paramamosain TaxID=85552 RepID=A0AAW0U8R9_SCYPA